MKIMQKINGFTINRLTVSGFKGFAEEISFDFGEMTFISGANYSGKTSIADAIAFAVTGQPFFGDRSSDRLQNPDYDAIRVVVHFTDNTSAARELTRCRKNSKMSITLDGNSIRQTDLNILFGERDVFLSIFNPLYFIEVLENDGKSLLEKLLPTVPHERVLAALSDNDRTLLENEKLSSPQAFLQNRRAEIRNLEEALIYQQGQDDAMAKQIKDKTTLLAEYRQQSDERGLTDDSSISGQLRELEAELDKRRASQYQSQYAQTIAEINAELKTLYANHSRFTKLQQEGKCPVCLQATADSEPIKVSLSDIVTGGKSLKKQLADAEALDTQALAVFEQFKADDIAKMEAELDILRDRYEKTQKLLDCIEEIEVWLAENSVSDKSAAISEQIKAKKTLAAAAVEYISKRAELTFTDLPMDNLAISLFDIVKSTGEVKDTFRFTYRGKPYRWLSLSETIRAGLEVAELIKTLAGRCYPTFIDNGESISFIGNIRRSGQFFFSKVVHNQPLTVTIKPAEIKTAA
jgi:DNA repair exonuclease SbcCD ATPase subunit